MGWSWRLGISSLSFPAGFVLTYKISNYLIVYYFDWWDSKFQDRAGALRFGNDLLPIFLIIAILSYIVALIVERQWFRRQSAAMIALIGGLVSIIQETMELLMALASRHANPSSGLGQATNLIRLLWVFAGPALTGIVLARSVGRFRSRANPKPAV